MLTGYKTYIVALIMLVTAFGGYLLGTAPAPDWTMVLNALGLAGLRAGIAKV